MTSAGVVGVVTENLSMQVVRRWRCGGVDGEGARERRGGE